jgi:hypothetical protein
MSGGEEGAGGERKRHKKISLARTLQDAPLEGPHSNVARYQIFVLGAGKTRLASKLAMNVLLILNDYHVQHEKDAAIRVSEMSSGAIFNLLAIVTCYF